VIESKSEWIRRISADMESAERDALQRGQLQELRHQEREEAVARIVSAGVAEGEARRAVDSYVARSAAPEHAVQSLLLMLRLHEQVGGPSVAAHFAAMEER
jgi:hypothetical protein